MHYRLWVLKGNGKTILVDSGLPAEEAYRRGITDVIDTAAALRDVGIEVADVSTVILTHLHWDHASNAAIFPRATFVAQRAELDWLSSPLIKEPYVGRFYSDIDRFRHMADAGRFQLLNGDERITEGVEAIKVAGHTPGMQIIAVDTGAGKAVISSDAIPLRRNLEKRIPNTIHINLLDAVAVFDRTEQLSPTALYTGHDVEAKISLPLSRTKPKEVLSCEPR